MSNYDHSTYLIVDALFGFGFQRRGNVLPDCVLMLKDLSKSTKILSIDVPSGSEDGSLALPWEPTIVCSLGIPKSCLRSFRGSHFLCSPVLHRLFALYISGDDGLNFEGRLYIKINGQ